MANKEVNNKGTEKAESSSITKVENLTLEGLKTRYEEISKRIGEKMIENNKTIRRLFTEVTIGSGTKFKKDKMTEIDGLLKQYENTQSKMESAAKSITEGDALDRAISDEPKVFKGTNDLRQEEQAYVQDLWEKQKKEIESQKQIALEKQNQQEGKFLTTEGNIESKRVRFEDRIPAQLEGILSLELTNKPKKEVGSNQAVGELHYIPGKVAGEETLGISVNGKNLEVKEVYENIDGSWTIDAGAYEFRTEGPLPQVIESPAPQITKEEQVLGMVEAAKSGANAESPTPKPDVKNDLRSRVNVSLMKMDGRSDSEIRKNLDLLDVENLKNNSSISAAIENINNKTASGENIEAELKTLAEQLEIPASQILNLRHTIESLIDADAREKLPKGKEDTVLATVKFAGYIGLGFFARGFTAVSTLIAARGVDSYLMKKEAGKKFQDAKDKSMAELATSGSALNMKMKQELIGRLASLKQEQINHAPESMALLQSNYEKIRDVKNDNERNLLISQSDEKIEAVSENIYLQSYEYYKLNRPDLTEENLIRYSKSAKWEFVKDQQGIRQKTINGAVNRTFDERVNGLIDKTVPTFRDGLKGAGLTENQSAMQSAAVTIGLGAGLRGLNSFASMHAGAFMGGGVIGEKAGNKMFGKELQRVTMSELQTIEGNPTDKKIFQLLGKIESQLNSPDDAIRFPNEHGELKKWLDNFDEQILDKMDNDEDRKSYIQNRGTGIEKWLAREKDQKDKIALSRWLGRLILAGSATAWYLHQQEMANQPKPVVAEQAVPAPVAEIHAPRLEGHITPGQGITQQMEEMINKGLESGKITEQNAQAFIDQNNLALEHAHQTGAITDKVYNAIHDRIANATNLHDKLMASTDAWGLDHKDFDMAKNADTVSINLESGTVEFVNRGDMAEHINVPTAHEQLANEFKQPPETSEQDLAAMKATGETWRLNPDQERLMLQSTSPEMQEELSRRGLHYDAARHVLIDDKNHGVDLIKNLKDFKIEKNGDNLSITQTNNYGVSHATFGLNNEVTGSSWIGNSGEEDVLGAREKLASGILNLQDKGIDISKISPAMQEELARKGFDVDMTSDSPAFTIGGHHFDLNPNAKSVYFEKVGDTNVLIQETKDSIARTPIGADGIAGNTEIIKKTFFTKLFN